MVACMHKLGRVSAHHVSYPSSLQAAMLVVGDMWCVQDRAAESAAVAWRTQWGVGDWGPQGAGSLGQQEREAVGEAVMRAHVAACATANRGTRALANHAREARAFAEFLRVWGKDWADVVPADVLVYLHTLQGPAGGDRAAPTTLRGRVAALAVVFQRQGRGQAWDAGAQRGNPAKGEVITEHLDTYQREQQAAGWAPRSAVPSELTDVEAMVSRLRTQGREAMDEYLRTGGVQAKRNALRNERDGVVLVWLWHSSRRGADVLGLTWEQVWDGELDELVTRVWERAAPGPSVLATPQRLKNSGRNRPASIELRKTADEGCGDLCPVRRAWQWWGVLQALGEPASGPLFPSYSGRNGMQTALTSAGFANRFRGFAGVAADGRTVHGIRRGRLKHAAADGEGVGALLQLAGISTVSVLNTYVDGARHLPTSG